MVWKQANSRNSQKSLCEKPNKYQKDLRVHFMDSLKAKNQIYLKKIKKNEKF